MGMEQLYPFWPRCSHVYWAYNKILKVGHHDVPTMNYHTFSCERPNEDILNVSINTTVEEYYKTQVMMAGMVSIYWATPDSIHSHTALQHPHIYTCPLLQLLFCRYALAVVLYHEKELQIEPYNQWLVLAQNFLYLDLVWNHLKYDCTNEQNIGPGWCSTDFSRYIATEVFVRCHELVYESLYCQQCMNRMLNISQVSIKTLGEWFVLHGLPLRLLISNRLVWVFGGLPASKLPSVNIAKGILKEAIELYVDMNHPVISESFALLIFKLDWWLLRWPIHNDVDKQRVGH